MTMFAIHTANSLSRSKRKLPAPAGPRWTRQDGTTVVIAEMHDDHLLNAAKMVIRNTYRSTEHNKQMTKLALRQKRSFQNLVGEIKSRNLVSKLSGYLDNIDYHYWLGYDPYALQDIL